ncbi:MAG: hypothetical protein H6705_07050 [Myxococcales bacterium]|nr:hypothetical protein [Myxococcales bacterium]
MRRRAWALATVVMLAATAQAEPGLRLEAAGGYDSNSTRSEGEAETGGAAARLVVDLSESARPASGWRVDGAWQGGVVRFFEPARQGEDALYQRVDAALRGVLVDRLTVGAVAELRDRSTRAPRHPRDFTLIRATAPVGYDVAGWSFELAPVGEWFHYKPDGSYDATSVGGRARVAWTRARWQASVYGEWLGRDYRGDDEGRASDALRRAGAGLRYAGTWLGTVGYGWSDNDTTRLEGGYARHAINVSATVPLPGAVLVSGRVSVVRILHAEAQALPDDQVLDDEGRSAVALRVERPVGDEWSLVAHGGWWGSPFETGPDYTRWLGLLGVSYGRLR